MNIEGHIVTKGKKFGGKKKKKESANEEKDIVPDWTCFHSVFCFFVNRCRRKVS